MNMGSDDLIYAEKNLLILNTAQFQVKKEMYTLKEGHQLFYLKKCDDFSPLVFTKQMC